MIRNLLIFSFLCLFSFALQAQISENLYAYYTFDDCTANDNIGLANWVPLNPINCVCGLKGQAVKFDGTQVIKLGDDNSGLNNTIASDEFTLVISLLSSK